MSGLPAHLLPHTVTKIRPASSTDSHGNDSYDYDNGARTSIEGWLQQDTRDEEFPDGRSPETQTWTFLTNHTDIDADDRIEWAEHPAGTITFEVHGPAEPTSTPAGFHHMEATLRVVSG